MARPYAAIHESLHEYTNGAVLLFVYSWLHSWMAPYAAIHESLHEYTNGAVLLFVYSWLHSWMAPYAAIYESLHEYTNGIALLFVYSWLHSWMATRVNHASIMGYTQAARPRADEIYAHHPDQYAVPDRHPWKGKHAPTPAGGDQS